MGWTVEEYADELEQMLYQSTESSDIFPAEEAHCLREILDGTIPAVIDVLDQDVRLGGSGEDFECTYLLEDKRNGNRFRMKVYGDREEVIMPEDIDYSVTPQGEEKESLLV